MEHTLSTCLRRSTPFAYLHLCQLCELDQWQGGKGRHPSGDLYWTTKNSTKSYVCFQWTVPRSCLTQVSKNGKHLPLFSCLHCTICQGQWWSKLKTFLAQHFSNLETPRENVPRRSKLNLNNILPNAAHLRPDRYASGKTEGSCWNVFSRSQLLWPCTELRNGAVLDFKEGPW